MLTYDTIIVFVIIFISILAAGIVIWVALKFLKNRPQAVFHDLMRKYPSTANTTYLSEAEREAFESVKEYVADKTRVEIASKSRLEQLRRIRGDLIFIQKEYNKGRFQKYSQLQDIWDLTLQKAAAQISEEYKFDNLLEQVAKLKKQMKVISTQDVPNVDRDTLQDNS